MSNSYTFTDTTTFTRTHAKHIAAKVATDLKRMQRFYDEPSDYLISFFEAEAVELLKEEYLYIVTYGFQRYGNWIAPTLRYTARDLLGAVANDDDPGRVRPGADVSGAEFRSYLTYSSSWDRATAVEREEFNSRLPIQRTAAPEPGTSGYWSGDLIYSAGGRALDRANLRSQW